jgi:hypothetical protein
MDEARTHLQTQIRNLNAEIKLLTRQRDQLVKASDLLVPVLNGTRASKQMPTRAERQRRLDALKTFVYDWRHSDHARAPFTAHDVVENMSEYELLGAFQKLLGQPKTQKTFNFRVDKMGGGKRSTTFVLNLDKNLKGV